MRGALPVWLGFAVGLSACPLPELGDLLPDAAAFFPDAAGGFDAAPVFDAAVGDIGPQEAGAALFVDEIAPSTGVVTGGYRVRITGEGFNLATTVSFGGVSADNLLLQNSRSMTLRVPPADSSGPVDVVVDNGASQVTLEAGFIYFDALLIDRITPRDVPTAGGSRLVVDGAGFVGELLVLCGGRIAAEVVVVTEDRLEIVAPPGPPGLADIEVLSTYGYAIKPLALRYFTPLRIDRAEPAVGPAAGGNTVILYGDGFSRDTTVAVDGAPVLDPEWIDSARIRFSAPMATAPGAVDLEVGDGLSLAMAPGGYAYLGAATGGLRLDAVIPPVGDAAGGEVVRLVGEQLDSGALSVHFGERAATVLEVGNHQALALTPAHAPGVVDVTASSEAGDAVLSGGFAFEERLRVEAVVPDRGSAAGGAAITVTGSGFTSSTSVHVGGRRLESPTLVDATTINGVTPVGSAGSVDVVVSDPERGEARLPDGFLYEGELHVVGVRPVKGAMAGGTYVQLYGSGFSDAPALQVFFDEAPATQVRVESDNLITVRTPPHGPDSVDVAVARGDDRAVASRAYTYFDPSFLIGGTRGGAIDGSVYVSCFHAITGMPLEGISVMLGTRPDTPYLVLTDAFGQATLSGADIHGPQTVTAAAAGYESISLIEVNASEITLFLFPTTMTPSTGQPPPMPPPPVISGRVYGFAKELFDPAALEPGESALAIVQTTLRSVFSSPGAPTQSQYVVAEGGAYTIPGTRVGRLAVVAVAGIFNASTGAYRLRQIGFRRGVTAGYGDVLEDIDVELSVPFNTELTLFLPDVPFGDPAPETSVVMPFLNLGGEGVYPLPQQLEAGASTFAFPDFPDVPGELLSFIAGVFTVTYDVAGQASLSSPYSVVVRDGVGDLRAGLTLDPILGFPELVEPGESGLMVQNRLRWKAATGTVPSYYNIYLSGFDGTAWEFFVPGTLSKLVVPVFPVLDVESAPQNVGLGAYQGWMSAIYLPGFTFDNFSYLDLSSLAWRSWTQDQFKFANSDTP